MDTSSSQTQWHPRNNAAIFIRALHLLDLDLLPDWPSISESTLLHPTKASSNTSRTTPAQPQKRTKSLEWALYHLFRLYSPSEAASRLSPYFPPATPILSRDLRAGLYKWLTELKQSGVLPRDTVLRKTMLDECKGDKFEELIARFAMLVVRKILSRGQSEASSGHVKRQTHDVGRTKRSTEAGKHQDPDFLVPLVLAHRVSLQHSLRKRQDLKEKATAYAQKLAQIQKDMASDLHDISQHSSSPDNSENLLSATDHRLLHERINLAFAGDRRWGRYIFEGAPSSSNSASARDLPEWPFEGPSPFALKDDEGEEDASQPMRQLQSLVSQHQERIARLTAVRDSLLSPSESINVSERTPNMRTPYSAEATVGKGESRPQANNLSHRPKPRFNRHQDLVLT
ncbi:uncharacterized protein Z520_08609 [Fonsecaea multimorphosa CBS 102226]|uniref:HAUS augmin-like complex subunit 6 N-terminal domain-containing protein n=1 Tax=Fonsecaea multimorphosa CBS 102226 TaxID=1442371 RepID=A0A0D2JY78_9EURO|nr:uncharacterized protein Z520_08609 [Fonsecaea multimorphosa CBS 102226]KIX95489.1 hypothetical protein Z520_08609 [Fonsecaea multimorphosa CBS 102226]OAL21335.1 hypothetical protein AYO22_08058 [Fonsecaea multimorphosa]